MEDSGDSIEHFKCGKDRINVIKSDAPLEDFPWFHGNISYADAEKLLKYQEDGTYLVRRSESRQDCYVLVVKKSTPAKQTLQFQIKYMDSGEYFQFGSGVFFSIPEIIEYFTNHTMRIYGIKLTAPLDKQQTKKTKGTGKRLAQLEDPRESCVQTKKYGKDWINVIEADAPLDDFPWFHGNISYAESEKLLKYQEGGTFLVRRRQSHQDWLVLVVKRPKPGKQAFQFHIKYMNPGEYFQIERDANIFFSIPKLIEYYTNHTILNFGIKLTAPLHKHEMNETESNVPDELSNDPRTRELYERALQKGTENDNTIRVMVIGCCEQGKTSLVRRLLKKSIERVETTNGIDLHKCTVISENEWKKFDNEDLGEETVQRLVNIALRERTCETFASVTHGEKGLLNIDVEKITTVTDISRTTDELKLFSASGLEIIDKSDEYKGKRRQNAQENKTKIAGAGNFYVKNKKVNFENLNSFQTELKRVESIEAEINLDNKIKLNIWDFGGQFVYYATHQIFHSKQAVYVLVFNLSISLDAIIEDKEFPLHQKRMRDYLKFWVASVNSFVGSSDGIEPAIILVGTHTDKLNDDSKVEDYFEEVRQIFDDSVCLNHIQHEQFAISNTSESESEIDALRSYITRLGKRQIKTRIPAKWILLEKALKMNKQKRIIKIDELIEIDSQTDSPLQTDNSKETMDQIKLFLSYHHAKGTFFYFDEDNLSDHVVLDPQFLVDAFRCVITSEKFCKVRPKMRSVWKELCKTAILRAELLKEVWRQEKDNDFYAFKQLLIEYMQKHHILAEVLAYNHNSELSVERLGYFIVPSLLKISADDEKMRLFLEGKPLSNVSLCYEFENEMMAPFTFQTCLAGIIGRWPLVEFNDNPVLFDNVAACEIERGHAGVLMLSKNKLELLVVSLCPPDNVKADVCDMFRRYVETIMIQRMHRLHENKHEGHFINPIAARCLHRDHGSKGSFKTFAIDNIQSCSDEKIPCPDRASHCLQVHTIMKEWFMPDFKVDKVPKTKLSNKEYSTLAMAIGKGWKLLGLQLGLDKIILDHICMNKDTAAMRIYEMFLEWEKKEGDNATLDVVVQAIENCDTDNLHVNWDVLRNIINKF